MKPDDNEDVGNDKRSSNERPAWISTDLVAETVRVWSACSPKPLSEQEAVALILQFGNLLDATGLTRKQE
jgi:hypothetical protein